MGPQSRMGGNVRFHDQQMGKERWMEVPLRWPKRVCNITPRFEQFSQQGTYLK